jgi:hypothetical protein
MVEVKLINIGGTAAYVQESVIKIYTHYTEKWRGADEPPHTATFPAFTLQQGGNEILKIPFEFGRVPLQVNRQFDSEGQPQTMFIRCESEIRYLDESKAFRTTGFRWSYIVKTKRFVADTDPEYEYAD